MSQKLSAYYSLVKTYDTIDKQQSLEYALQMLELTNKNTDVATPAEALKALDLIITRYEDLNDYENCVLYCKQAINISQKLQNELDVAYFSGVCGSVNTKNGNYFEALQNYKLAAELTRKNNKKYSEASFLNNIGAIYYYLGDDFTALEYFLKSYHIKERNNFTVNLAPSLINIGGIYSKSGKIDQAILFHEKALSYSIKNENKYDQVKSLISLGEDHLKLENTDKAIAYYYKALPISSEINDLTPMANILAKLGTAYLKINKTEKAISFTNKALIISDSIDYQYGISTFLISLGNIYIKTGKYEKAQSRLKESLSVSKKISATENILDNYRLLSELFKEVGNYQKSLEFYVLYVAVKDSLFSEESKEKYSVIQTKYETEKKQYELDLLKHKNDINELKILKSRYLLFGLAGVFLLIVTIAILLFRQNKIRTLQKTIWLEQKLLRTQINPHFIFNTLTAVQKFIVEKSTMLACDYLGRFSMLVRFILNSSSAERISLEDEIKFLENYLQLQALRFDDKFTYELTIGEGIKPGSMMISPMLIQPFIENAIEHGVKLLKDPGLIKINFALDGKYIRVEIEDNGVGRAKAKQIMKQNKPGHKSMATIITKERLLHLNRKSKERINFRIIDLFDKKGKPAGTKVLLTTPVYSE